MFEKMPNLLWEIRSEFDILILKVSFIKKPPMVILYNKKAVISIDIKGNSG
jgi:hypothetical protein